MLKLYRKTFIISCTISIASFLLSIAFEIFQNQSPVLSFFENYAIGIACSGALVAITTFLQFQSEFNQVFRPFAIAISNLVLILYSAIIYKNDPEAFEREFNSPVYEYLESVTGKACKKSDIVSLGWKRQKVFKEIRDFLFSLRGDFLLSASGLDSIKVILDPKRLFQLIDLSLTVFPDSNEKEELIEIKGLLDIYLNDHSKREVSP